MAVNYLDALLLPRKDRIPEVVAALRDIHARKSIGPQPQATESSSNGDSTAPLTPHDPRVAFGRVARGVEDLERLFRSALGSERARDSRPDLYQFLQASFGELETRLRRHAETVDHLLNREKPATASPSSAPFHQQTVYLQCPSGGRSAARFRCVNRQGESVSVTSSLRPFTMNLEPLAATPTLSLRPGSFVLDPSASRIITVEIDFAACPELASGALQASVDLRMNEETALKVWIEVDLHEQC